MKTWRGIRWYLLGLIIVFAITTVPAARDWSVTLASPVLIQLRRGAVRIIDMANILDSIPRLAQDNGRLTAKVNELSAKLATMGELAHENALLRQELKLASPDRPTALIAAQVINRSASVSQQTIIVNKGADSGLRQGMAVITQGYLVGQVVEALPKTSRVNLIVGHGLQLPIILQNSRSLGLLRGGADGLIIDDIPRDVTINQGEEVLTAQQGDIIKGGIPVGYVTTVLSGNSDVFQMARIHSPIDPSRLEIVFGVP